MKTIIIQSYRTSAVPEWINLCMQSVKDWCKQKDYEYQFFGDELFLRVPLEFSCGNIPRLACTDFARLVLCRELLAPDTRVAWIDADVLIFNEAFDIEYPTEKNMVMCQEVWHLGKLFNIPVFDNRVNNAVMVFNDIEPLDMLIALSKFILRHSWPNDWMLGPSLMTPLMQKVVTKPQLQRNVGCLGPNTFIHLHKNIWKYAKALTTAYGCPLYATNLCHSFTTKEHSYDKSPEEMLQVVLILKENANAFANAEKASVSRKASPYLKVYLKIQKLYRMVKSFRDFIIKQLLPVGQFVLSY